MNIKTNQSLFLCSLALLCSVHGTAQGAPVLNDNFESGSFKSFWTSNRDVSISSERAKSGNYSSRWYFKGGSPSQDAFAERRFDLGKQYPELTISFDWYVPANYFHRNSPSSDNNKFFRLWPDEYSSREKIGASTYPTGDGDSQIGEDFSRNGSSFSTNVTASGGFITKADRDKWMAVKIYVKAATSSSPAVFRLYKNGKLFHENTNIPNNWTSGNQGYQYGYLLGWSNSGYDQDTVFYIDNVQFSSGVTTTPISPAEDQGPNPPVPPKMTAR